MRYDDKFLKELKSAKDTKENVLEVCDQEEERLVKELKKVQARKKQIEIKYDNQRIKKVKNFLDHYQKLKKESKSVLDILTAIHKDLYRHGLCKSQSKNKKYNLEKLSTEVDKNISYEEFKQLLVEFKKQDEIVDWDAFCNITDENKYTLDSLTKSGTYYEFLYSYCEALLEKACRHFGHDYKVVSKKEEILPFPDRYSEFYVPERQNVYSCECKNCGCQTAFPNKVVNRFKIDQDGIDSYSEDVEYLKLYSSHFGKKQRLLTPSEY
ncbi:MAG: hypothetical protein E7159_05505 [Firmicutes bacterium]|nr:hypothetical protein [Bacillota bacterium]